MSELYSINVQFSGNGLLVLTKQLKDSLRQAEGLDAALQKLAETNDAVFGKMKTYAKTATDNFVAHQQATTQLKIALSGTPKVIKETFSAIQKETKSLSRVYAGTEADFLKMASTMMNKGIQQANVQKLMAPAAKLATALDMPYEKAAEQIAQLSQSTGIAAGNMDGFIDKLFRTKDFQGMADAFNEVSLSLDVLGMQGLEAQNNLTPVLKVLGANKQAGTALSAMLKSSHDAANVAKAEKMLSKAGIDIPIAFTDAEGKSLGWDNFMQQLDELKELDGELKDKVFAQLFGTGSQAAMKLAQTGQTGLTKESSSLEAQTGLDAATNLKLQELGTSLKKLDDASRSLSQTIGGLFAEEYKWAIDMLTKMTHAVTDFVSSNRGMIKGVIYLTAAVVGFGKLYQATQLIRKSPLFQGFLTQAQNAISKITGIFSGFLTRFVPRATFLLTRFGITLLANGTYIFSLLGNMVVQGLRIIITGVLAAISSKTVIVTAIIALISSIFFYLYYHVNAFKGFVDSIVDMLPSQLSGAVDFISDKLNALAGFFGWIDKKEEKKPKQIAPPARQSESATDVSTGMAMPIAPEQIHTPNQEMQLPHRAPISAATAAVQGKQIAVNYNPTIHFSGAISETDRNNFRAMLQKHKDDIVRLVDSANQRQTALAY
ncbi:phage tail tape measure protein, TP901 family [Chloroherpeton thalassium ATCC 35110]|uniref:Phage tail tape measure protein, TP901 family n=1 Tax=Chloroherpeton thalassium (strain ATCC 35110 / GB-78) TaxID=517418 RepID=B3QTJ1_CHLT3|nr:phage tail tape measure protein [Chloroherpeton thalassium]ACF12737.1 phage tail tape measure protein, TP901 family [Chloroherpeton thalassium ATCC 35110]